MRLPRVIVIAVVLCAMSGLLASAGFAASPPTRLSPTRPFTPAPRARRAPGAGAAQRQLPASLPVTGAETPVQLALAAFLLLTGVTLARVSRRWTPPA